MNAAILLGCCGVPARWAGQEKTAQEAVKRIRSEWEKLGKPLFVTACPTCLKNLRQSLPEAETVSLYSWFAEHPEAFPNSVKEGESVYVLDPCASAEDPSVQESVRRLLGISGYRVKNKTADVGCCGFGGHIYSSVPALYHEFARRRLKDREGITVSYCVNCRDVFAEKGADSRHILSLLFDIPDERRLPPELDMRRENRRQLKGYFTGEKRMSVRSPYNIVIPMEIMKKMDKKMILREQIEKIITESEQTGRKIADDENALFYAHRVFGAVTIWAVYMRNEDTIEVTNVYVHRVKIGESQDAVL